MTLNTDPDSVQAARRSLADLQPGETAEVVALHSEGAVRRRLMDLGIVPGTRITAELRSPLSDPVAYRVRGALIALRQGQAVQIEIRSLTPETR